MKTSKLATLLAIFFLLLSTSACQSEPTVEPQPTIQEMQPEPTITPQQMEAEPTKETSGDSDSETAEGDDFEALVSINPADLISSIQPTEARLYNPFTPIQIEFNVAVVQQSVEEHFEVRPPVVGEIEWRDGTFLFWPTEPFKNGTTYEFGFEQGVRVLDSDQILNTPQFWSFETESVEGRKNFEATQQLASFGREVLSEGAVKLETVSASGSRIIEFRFLKRKPAEVTFNLYPASVDQYLVETLTTPAEAPLYSWSHTTSLNLESLNTIEQATVPTEVPAGLYLMEMETPFSSDLILLLVSDYTLIAKGAEDEIAAWVQTSSGQPVASQQTTVWDDQGNILSQQPTDAQGFVRHSVPTATSTPYLLTANVNEQLALVGLSLEWDDNRVSGGLGGDWICGPLKKWGDGRFFNEKRLEVVIRTDRNVYAPGSTVYYKAFLREFDDGLLTPVPEDVPISVRAGGTGDDIYSEELFPTPFGTVSGNFIAPEADPRGFALIELMINGEEFTQSISISEATDLSDFKVPNPSFSIQHDLKNSGDLTIQTNKDRYISREPATVSINSTFGGPAMLIVERGKVRRYETITLTPPTTVVDLLVAERDAPNVFITVSAFRPIDMASEFKDGSAPRKYSLSDVELLSATTEIFSSVANKDLNIEIIPDKDGYTSGETGQFKVLVTNQQGIPVSAEVSLTLQEESINRVYPPESEQRLDLFYAQQPLTLNTFYSLSPERDIGHFAGGGCSGGGSPSHYGAEAFFRPETVVIPNLITDFAGETQSSFTLPASPGQWRIIATAITADTQIGETDIIIETK